MEILWKTLPAPFPPHKITPFLPPFKVEAIYLNKEGFNVRCGCVENFSLRVKSKEKTQNIAHDADRPRDPRSRRKNLPGKALFRFFGLRRVILGQKAKMDRIGRACPKKARRSQKSH